MGLLVLLLSFAYFMAGLKARGQESKGSSKDKENSKP